jgi:hypothetical protein
MMREQLRTYSQILQMRSDTIHTLLQSEQGVAYALKLFVIVSLIAGLGLSAGLPAALRTPTMVERFDQTIESVREVVASATAAIESAVATAQGRIDRAAQRMTAEFDRRFGGFLEQISALFDRFASPQTRLTALLARRIVSVAEIEGVVGQARPTAAEMVQLLTRANASEAETRRLLQLAQISPADYAAARATAEEQTNAALVALQPILDALAMSPSEFEQLLAEIPTTPEQVVDWISALSTTPEQVGAILATITATPDRVKALVAAAREEVIRMEPPLGERPSRVIRLGGVWLASPLHYAANWILFVFVLMLAAKSVGGRATLPQHLGAIALSSAPAIFFLLSYAPYLGDVLPAPTAAAIYETGRILALIGIVWCGLLLLKTLSVAHGFGMWKSAGVVVLALIAMVVVAPLALLLAAGFLAG